MKTINELSKTLRQAAEEELMCREASDTSDLWMDEAGPENVLALEKAQQQIQAHERAELTWMNALDLPDEATRNDILPAIHAEKYLLRNANTHISKLERANVAQDDHINQQQDRIDTLEKRNAELGGQLSRYSVSPGQADQRTCESRAVRDALGFEKDADNVAPIDLRERIDGMRAPIAELEAAEKRIAELEARTVNLPAACADDEYFIDGVFQALRYERDIERAVIAAGIKVI
ncbi:TPA: hypothetical protein JL066_002920 [Salmonella enterica]|nr:hypothetical protein [Salmonella enterica]EHV2094504.1 hypothetical protein [Salmonella enterica]HAW5564137.1 hypothetical protein [Salmonella enterica]